MTPNARFKTRLVARELLVGCFVKTPHPIVVEVLGAGPLDFLVLDAEHAPFDRAAIDLCMMAARAVGCPIVVRVPDTSWVLNVLDCGAAGVMVPHVVSADQARGLVAAMRYGPGGRGFAGSPRAAGYGTRPMAEHRANAYDEVALICQIEDPEGVECVEDIAAVPGVDALFLGRADMAVGMGLTDFFAPELTPVSTRVMAAPGAATGLFCAPAEDFAPWVAKGASFIVAGSEHSMFSAGAAKLAAARDALARRETN